MLGEKDTERLMTREVEKAISQACESSILNELTDVRSPDGVKVLHKGQGAKNEGQEIKRRFTSEAKRNLKEFMRI